MCIEYECRNKRHTCANYVSHKRWPVHFSQTSSSPVSTNQTLSGKSFLVFKNYTTVQYNRETTKPIPSQSTFAAKWHTQTWTEEVRLTLCPTGSALLLRLTDGDRRIFLWALSMTTWGSSFPSLEHLHTPIPNRITLWISNWLLLRAMCSFRVKSFPSVNVIHLLIGQSNYSASHITCSKNSMQRSTLTVISHTNSRLWRFITVIDFKMIKYNAIY